MNIKQQFIIRKIRPKECHSFLLKIHYSRRIPNIWYSFGLFNEELHTMIGVITFGAPPCPTEQMRWVDFNLLELNRLCLIKPQKRNVLSYFVSQSLKMLPNNSVIISYADKTMNHSGYIYQSTNWIYTGIGSINTKTYVMKDGKERHSRHMKLINMNDVIDIKYSIGKHRYFYFVGNKNQKRKFMKILHTSFKILDYPKNKNEYYDIENKILLQSDLNKYSHLWQVNNTKMLRQEVNNMTEENEVKTNNATKENKAETNNTTEETTVSWDEAISGGNFIKLEEDEMKTLTIKNWKLVKVEKEFNGVKTTKVEFQSEVTEEDGQPVEKMFNTVSDRLKKKLREIFENSDKTKKVKITVIRVGDKFNTNYSVKKVKEE